MKCIQCGNSMDYGVKRKPIYTIKNDDGVVIGINCRFCGWNHYKKKKIQPKKEVVEVDDSEFY